MDEGTDARADDIQELSDEESQSVTGGREAGAKRYEDMCRAEIDLMKQLYSEDYR
jgi:hypothetical protein